MKFKYMLLPCLMMTIAHLTSASEVRPDIAYDDVAGQKLLLDASTPAGQGPFPVAIVVHGGGWSSGDKEQDPAPLLEALTQAHFTWFSINYRLAPANRWPACFDDVKSAVRWVKTHAAEYKGDPKRIALIGYSAGGQLVCLAAVTATPETQVQAVVGLAPPTDLELDLPQRGGLSPSLQSLLNQPHELTDASRKQLQDLSAVHDIHPGLPPFLIMHGTADKSVPYAGSVAFVEKLRAAGVPSDLITIKDAPHRLSEWAKHDSRYAHRMTSWLNDCLARAPGATTRPTVSPLPLKLWDGAPPDAVQDALPEYDDGTGRIRRVSVPEGLVYLPPNREHWGHRTAIIVCPGGGYTHLTALEGADGTVNALVPKGVVIIALKYRLAPPSKNVESDATADLLRAIQRVREHANAWGVDPTRVGVLGWSAGANLGLNAATRFSTGIASGDGATSHPSARPDFAILFSTWPHGHQATEYPVPHNAPPLLMGSALDDETAPCSFSKAVAAAYEDAAGNVELWMVKSGGHGAFTLGAPDAGGQWAGRALAWLQKYDLYGN